MAVTSTKVPELISDGVKEVTRIADEAISGITNSVPQTLYGPAPKTDEMNLEDEIKDEIIDFQEDLYGPPPSPGVDPVDPQGSNIPITVEGPETLYGPPPKPIEGGSTDPNKPIHFSAPEIIYGPPPAPTESDGKSDVVDLIDKMTDPNHYN